jgi:C-terminal processing protease CtpA/Prc
VLKYQNVLQEQNIDQRFLVDRNFDGKFDESDADVCYDLNFAVLAGRESYSCGNLFPSMMKDLGYMTLGERSGGGACTILELNTADGFFYHISAYQMRLTNAAGEVIDAGIVPDAELVKTDADGQQDYSDFYNLDLLSDLINEFYAEEGAA